MKSFTSAVQRPRHKRVVYFFATRAEVGGNHVLDSAPLSQGESWDSTSRNRPISSEAENRHRSFGEEDGREGVLGEGESVGPGDDDEREGVLGVVEVDILERRSKRCLL